MLVSGLIRSAHLSVRFGRQIGEILLAENERSCAFVVKINLDVPIHELSTIAYEPYSISSHFDHI